jgi:hypothetical protein
VFTTTTATDRTSFVGSLVAGLLAFCYFAQTQKLAEMSLFKELFTEFNRRYDALNERLCAIGVNGDASDASSRKVIVDFFNLCAEEYLWYSEGYIHTEVWRSWCAGMVWYFEREPFRTTWDEESLKNSYYRLSLDAIRRRAA